MFPKLNRRRIRKLTLERERTFIFRSRGASRLGWCEQCQAEVELMSVPDAAQETRFSELTLYQLIEAGDLHFEREGDVNILVCLDSLRRNQHSLKKVDTNKHGKETINEGND
jgi:hypothetical protein